jgi:hypothetical protein
MSPGVQLIDISHVEVMIPWNNANVVPEWKPLISVFDGIKEL